MLETLRDNNGNITACLEWWLVNADGSFNSTGQFVWINQMEVSEINRNHTYQYVQEFIKRITDLTPAQFGYFERRDKKNNKVRMYSRKRWLKLLGGGYEHSKVFTEAIIK